MIEEKVEAEIKEEVEMKEEIKKEEVVSIAVKKSRQVLRQEARQAEKIRIARYQQEKQRHRNMSAPVKLGDYLQAQQSIQQILSTTQQSLGIAEVMIAAYHRLLVDNKIVTKQEINDAIEYECKRVEKLKEIRQAMDSQSDTHWLQRTPEEGPVIDYNKILTECKEWQIDADQIGIVKQMKEDKTISDEDTDKLLKEYNLLEVKEVPNDK